jgi:cell wall-associated NlpC family hydrolase
VTTYDIGEGFRTRIDELGLTPLGPEVSFADDYAMVLTDRGALWYSRPENLVVGPTLAPDRPKRPLQDVRRRVIEYARTLLGVPYEINLPGYPKQPGRGMGKQIPPDGGIDCSGYVLQVLNHVGLLNDLDPLYTSVVTLSEACTEVDASASEPGDIIFFSGTYKSGLSHVGIVTEAGGRRFINAREPRVSEDGLNDYWSTHLSHYGRVPGL